MRTSPPTTTTRLVQRPWNCLPPSQGSVLGEHCYPHSRVLPRLPCDVSIDACGTVVVGVPPVALSMPALRCALCFAPSAGGSGLTKRDHISYAQSPILSEREVTRDTKLTSSVSAAFPSAYCFLTATHHEQNRVLAARRWMQVNIETGGHTFVSYYRDVL